MVAIKVWLPIWIARIVIKKLFRIEIEVWAGTFLYGIGLVILRWCKSIIRLFVRAKKAQVPSIPRRPSQPESVLDINSFHRLKGLEVVLGYAGVGRVLKIDLDRYHTIIAGSTGTGKTNILNSIIAQLVQRGPVFLNNYDLYMIDLKSSKEDNLFMWQPVITGYYSIDADGTTASAIEALVQIADEMQHDTTGKRKVVIIDELAMLTSMAPNSDLRKRGQAILMRLAAQLRDKGSLVVATQRPVFDTIPRAISGNLERKVCLRVDDNRDSARLILRHMPKTDATSLLEGEFILKEPGNKNIEQVGRSMLMELPGDIDRVVMSVIDTKSSSDNRLRLFREVANHLDEGGRVSGINRVSKSHDMSAEEIKHFYRNYAHSGPSMPLPIRMAT